MVHAQLRPTRSGYREQYYEWLLTSSDEVTFLCISFLPPPFVDHERGGFLLDVVGVALASGQEHLCSNTIHTCAVRCTYERRCGFASGELHHSD